MIAILIGVSTLGVIASLAYYAAAVLAAFSFARLSTRIRTPAQPVSVPKAALLKPLFGGSASLAENLDSFIALDHPNFDVVIGVANENDPAFETARTLADRQVSHPRVKLVIGEEPGCANCKVAKLIRMADAARDAELLVLSDADVRVAPDHLRRIAADFQRDGDAGAVTCLYRAIALGGLASRMEALFVNTDFAPMVLVSAAIEPIRHAFGATIAMRRDAFESIGGFRPFKDLLADDFFLGRAVAEHGYRILLSSSVVTIACEERRFADFWHHQLRWARTYRTVRPESLATIVIHGPFWALILLCASGFAAYAWAVLALVLAARLAMGVFVANRALGLGAEGWRGVWLLPIKDLTMTAIWFASLASNQVRWGGKTFRVARDGTMSEVRG